MTAASAQSIRQPAVAGGFYPGDADQLRGMLSGLLADARSRSSGAAPMPKALIAPHAGYIYSGTTAATAYATLTEPEKIRRVIVLGPAHRVAFDGFAIPSVDAFQTPLGQMAVDKGARDAVAGRPDVHVRDDAHEREHSLEVHLPFLQMVLADNVTVLPIVVGGVQPGQVAELLETLWGGEETLIVISTDLSHYLDYDTASEFDAQTVQLLEQPGGTTLNPKQACGSRPVNGMLMLAERKGLRITQLDVRNSGDTAGSKDRVVGYGSWALHPADQARLSDKNRSQLIMTACQALVIKLKRDKRPEINLDTFPSELRTIAASFVTINLNKRLRGCIGSLKAHRPLAADVAWNAVSAGFEDPRFRSLTAREFLDAELEISILSNPAPMDFSGQDDLLSQLRPHQDGLILQSRGKRGTFLPKVWEGLDTPTKFLNGLKVKAGLPGDHWDDDVQVWRYTTETFGAPVPRDRFAAKKPAA